MHGHPNVGKFHTCSMCGETKPARDFWHRYARSGGVIRRKPFSKCIACGDLGEYDKHGEKRKPAANAPKPTKRTYTTGECPLCGKVNRRMQPENAYAFVCNTGDCQRTYWEGHRDGWYHLSAVYFPFCHGCGAQFAARIHDQEFCSAECGQLPEGYARQLRQLATESGPTIRRQEVFERDGYVCYLCGEPIVEKRGMDGPSIDHVVPIVGGGTHTLDNVRTTHLRCNLIKGDSAITQSVG